MNKDKKIYKLCPKLPDPFDCSKGIPNLLKDAHYYFKTEILNSSDLIYHNKKIELLKYINKLYPWEESFDHLVTRSYFDVRVFSEERMATLPWLKYILKHCVDSDCPYMNIYQEDENICILCQKVFYYIILKKKERRKGYILLTAYPKTAKEHYNIKIESQKVLVKERELVR